MRRIIPFLVLFVFLIDNNLSAQQNLPLSVDVCIYGGTSAGVIAAYTAKKMGKSVILIEPGKHLGGMSSGGLGFTDIGNKYVVTGLARDFYRRVGLQYGKFEQWIFEPHVAESVFNNYVKRAQVNVLFGRRVISVKKSGNLINEIVLENSYRPAASTNRKIKAKIFIDCSYEGDLMAKAGVSYAVGREANNQYGETFNGVQLMKRHQFPDGIDPYIIPGDSTSGLVWGIRKGSLQPNGTGNSEVQAYCFRITLTNKPENRIPITKPDNYDPSKYELLLRLMNAGHWKSMFSGFIWSVMPGGKTDINNFGGFSTDMIGMNWNYPDGDYKTREKILKEHEDYTKGLLYFVSNDPRIPIQMRDEMKLWGYPKDEYQDNGNWTPQLYVREARRMIGELVMTQQHCQGKEIVTDGIGMAAYTMDSHNCDRVVVNGMVKNEGNVEIGGFGPYPISYRAIVPKQEQSANLLVPVCLSATHIAYGSIRMEPVFMVLGQSAAVAACMAIDHHIAVQQVKVKDLQQILHSNPLADGSTPEVLVDNDDTAYVTIKGDWKRQLYGGYGPSFLSEDSKGTSLKSVRFSPKLTKTGEYSVYVYVPKLANGASVIPATIYNGKTIFKTPLSRENLKVEGQTSGEWMPVGKYRFEKGSAAYLEITNKNADNAVVADAVLFVYNR
jgi:hypothetical protein